MIIGLKGAAGSGKSTVAALLVKNHHFVEVAFADPLKRFCREVFGFSDEQLWGPSSARNAPDPRYPRPKITDWVRDGHMTAPEATHGSIFACTKCGSKVNVEDSRAFDTWCSERCGPIHLTPRHALQQLGAEWGRACYEDVWIDIALRTARTLLSHDQATYTAREGLAYGPLSLPRPCGVVIGDTRYPNEWAAVRAAGGSIWGLSHGAGLGGAAGQHSSEAHTASGVADVLVPDSALEDLPFVVAHLLWRPNEQHTETGS